MKLSKYALGGSAAILTSMGLIAGLNFGEHARVSIIGGLLIVAVADNISDSFGIHILKESENSDKAVVFSTTFGNFFARLLVTLSFVAWVIFLPSNVIFYFTTFWGLLLLTVISVKISQSKKTNQLKEVAIHLVIAVLVVIISRYLGFAVAKYF